MTSLSSSKTDILKALTLALALLLPASNMRAENTEEPTPAEASSEAEAKPSAKKSNPSGVPPVVHSKIGDKSEGVAGHLQIVNAGKRQQYSGADRSTFDTDIFSPKSVSFSHDGKRFYVNSLEGCKTVVYDSKTLDKIATINYKFDSGKGDLWAVPSGFYPFRHYKNGEDRAFQGKPVESAWSHNGRYLWVPFYRRTFDINAQDPSAIAVIDASDNKIIRMFETGPLPKMVASSPDGKYMAITHWGDNTVGMIDISSANPKDWHHLAPITVGAKFTPNYPLDKSVDRDSGSGNLLRGTIFTPDSRYLLISAMAGPMGVIDVKNHKYAGSVPSLYGIRHLTIADGKVFGSKNSDGAVVRFGLDEFVAQIDKAVAEGARTIPAPKDLKEVKVGGGARTLEVTQDGKYIFVACNSASALYAVDAETMTVADKIRVDSYPVGLAISLDGRRVIVTSQGRKGFGGNAVNIYDIDRPDLANVSDPNASDPNSDGGLNSDGDPNSENSVDSLNATGAEASNSSTFFNTLMTGIKTHPLPCAAGILTILIFLTVLLLRRHPRK